VIVPCTANTPMLLANRLAYPFIPPPHSGGLRNSWLTPAEAALSNIANGPKVPYAYSRSRCFGVRGLYVVSGSSRRNSLSTKPGEAVGVAVAVRLAELCCACASAENDKAMQVAILTRAFSGQAYTDPSVFTTAHS
jgi:hypothetical protein